MGNTSLGAGSIEDVAAVQAFYADYMEVLDDERLQEWPDFFTEDCLYQIIPRENFDRDSALCLMQADGRNMLLDRVQGILKTQKYGPQRCRRFYSGLKISRVEGGVIHTRQNVVAFRSLLDQPTSILLCGASYDQLCRSDSRLLLQRRVVVSDTEIIDNALILPL